MVWGGNEAAIVLEFDTNGQLHNKTWMDAADGLRAWLRRNLAWIAF